MADRVSLRALGLFVCLLGTSLCAMATLPQRIVSLTPHLTELLFDIGAGDRVVATDDASDYPAEVANLPGWPTIAASTSRRCWPRSRIW